MAPLLTGFLIDVDHLFDHYLYHQAPDHAKEHARRKLVLALHGWELLPLWAAVEPRLKGRISTDHGLMLGYLFHLLTDQLTNEALYPLTYSLLFRASRRFRGPFFPHNPGQFWRREPLHRLWRWL